MPLLDDYKKFLRERGKSENTIKTYSGHVNEYYRWVYGYLRGGTDAALPYQHFGFSLIPAEHQEVEIQKH